MISNSGLTREIWGNIAMSSATPTRIFLPGKSSLAIA